MMKKVALAVPEMVRTDKQTYLSPIFISFPGIAYDDFILTGEHRGDI